MLNNGNGFFVKHFIERFLKWKQEKNWAYRFVAAIIIFFAGGLAQYFYQDLIVKGFKPADKYVAVVMSKNGGTTFTIPEEFGRGFGDEVSFKASSGQTISFVKEDDFLSISQAAIIAKKLIDDPDCVLIIGNSTSQLSEVTLNEILKSEKKNADPSFMLPIATADNIIDKAKDQKYKSILRLMPNNDKQAKTIKDFIFSRYRNPKVLILCDEENITYSYNLSQKIADNIIISNGSVVLKKNYGNANTFMGDYQYLRDYDLLPDIIVFVGISSNGILFDEQLRGMGVNAPVIFTDGCTVNQLMERSRDNPNHFFISAVDSDGSVNTPTYQPVGVDAKEIAKLIIGKIKGDVTRETVAKFIQKNRTDVVLTGKAGKYSFDENGDNNDISWKVYSYVNRNLTRVYGNN